MMKAMSSGTLPTYSRCDCVPLEDLVTLLQARGWVLGTAESCSGGLIAHRLTNLSGVSAVYAGGVVSYSNALKMRLLGVPEATLEAHGAVSPETARAMVLGAQERLSVDWAVAVTGIAGPTGGTPEKPVGLVYMAVAGPGARCAVRRYQFHGDRESIKTQTADAALTFLWETMTT